VTRLSTKYAAEVTPSARRLLESLRDIGYDFVTAVADIVDNSISAGATRIDVVTHFDGPGSRVLIADDGAGMTETELTEALRLGTRRDYFEDELGRFGLGLKTASLSQCRSMTVVTRRAALRRRFAVRMLDLDLVIDTDRWIIIDPGQTLAVEDAQRWLADGPGTVVVWEELDRVLPETRPEGGWARRRLDALAEKTAEYLAIVFHRFLEGAVPERELVISVNGEKVIPWNPFAPSEQYSVELRSEEFELVVGDYAGIVTLVPHVLPSRNRFSSLAEFERFSGPKKWNRQQGMYIYRADRMIQSGGWCGIRAADEHTKLARVTLDFPPELDALFQVNVAKMRVTLPAQLRPMIERPIKELCNRAQVAYRKDAPALKQPRTIDASSARGNVLEVGLALCAAAVEVDEFGSLKRIIKRLRRRAPEIADALGL
jgi:hypothetical protein